jgi:hypothetical protein
VGAAFTDPMARAVVTAVAMIALLVVVFMIFSVDGFILNLD